MPTPEDLKRGNANLLKLASILDTADAKHRAKKEPTYYQVDMTHPCGTPACALGHWRDHVFRKRSLTAAKRAKLLSGYSAFCLYLGDEMVNVDPYVPSPYVRPDNADIASFFELFSSTGCGGARTAKQAAKFIRRFVARRKAAARKAAK